MQIRSLGLSFSIRNLFSSATFPMIGMCVISTVFQVEDIAYDTLLQTIRGNATLNV